jgi:undecaprenyl diphosphate synthase
MNPSVQHLGIIMDGNRRWAARRGLPSSLGHRAGVSAARRVVESLRRRDIPFVTLYAFSSDNWRRSSDEVSAIFGVLDGYLSNEVDVLVDQRVRVQVIGRRDRLPARTRWHIDRTEAKTADGDAMLLRLAIDYSSRD